MKYLLSLGLVILMGSLVGCTRAVIPPTAGIVAQPTHVNTAPVTVTPIRARATAVSM